MVAWPAGHRIEDYQFVVYNKAATWLGDLVDVHKPRGKRAVWGQMGCSLTFSLERHDPWASVLNEKEDHLLQVFRDEEQVFAGFQVKMDRPDDLTTEESYLQFEFLPMSRIMGWRKAIPISGSALSVTDKVDDGFKWLAERSLGSSAGDTPDGDSRVLSFFTIAPDKGQYPSTVTLSPTGQNMYEYMQQWGQRYDVDFDVYWNNEGELVFETWYPRRGIDSTEDNTEDNPEIIFTDKSGNIVKQKYGWDVQDLITVAYGSEMDASTTAESSVTGSWLMREGGVDSNDTDEREVLLESQRPRIFCTLEEFRETKDKQWIHNFDAGTLITWKSNRLGYGPHDAIIASVEWEIDDAGFEHLKLELGDTEPDITDKMRGGGRGKDDPSYTAPPHTDNIGDDIQPRAGTNVTGTSTDLAAADHQHKSILAGDTPTNVSPDADGLITIEGDGSTVSVTEDAPSNKLVLAARPGGICLWLYNSESGYYYTRYAAEAHDVNVIIGKDAIPAQKLHVFGWTRLEGDIHSEIGNEKSVAVWQTIAANSLSIRPGQSETVHINQNGTYIMNSRHLKMFTGAGYDEGDATFIVRGGSGDTFIGVNGAEGLTVAGATGHSIWKPAAEMTWETHVYRMPTAAPVGCNYLRTPSGGSSPWQLEWSTPIYVQDAEPSDTCPHIWIDTDETPDHALWSRNGGGAYLYPTTAGDSVYVKDAGNVTKFSVAGSDGDTMWAAGALLTLEGTIYRAPTDAPAATEVLTAKAVNGTVELEWAAGGGAPGGNNTEIQYNNAGAFGGVGGFIYDAAGHTVEFHALSLEVHDA